MGATPPRAMRASSILPPLVETQTATEATEQEVPRRSPNLRNLPRPLPGTGKRILVITSDGFSTLAPGPVKNSASGMTRRPWWLAATTLASSTSSGGMVSPMGEESAMLPARVAMLRTSGLANCSSASAKKRASRRITGEAMMSAITSPAPISTWPFLTAIPFRAFRRLTSTRVPPSMVPSFT